MELVDTTDLKSVAQCVPVRSRRGAPILNLKEIKMYGELRTALNNVASQFGQLALRLEESGHTKARAVINNVKKLHEIDDYCAAHHFARNTDPLIKALAFNISDYDYDFVNAVVIGATGRDC